MCKLVSAFGLLILSFPVTTSAEESSPNVLLNFDYESINLMKVEYGISVVDSKELE